MKTSNRLRLPILVISAACALLGSSTPLRAQEWTRFRGPNGSGIGTANVPARISEANYNWRVALPGIGHSCPVLWGRKLFITSAEETAGKRNVICVDASSGQQLWMKTYAYKAYPKHELNSAASCTPAVDAERVYVVWPAPDTYVVCALDHSGKEVWKRDLGTYSAQHGGAASPIVSGEMLIVTKEPDESAGCLVGLDRKTGAVRWKRDRPSGPAAYATPMVYQPSGGAPEIVFTSSGHGFTSLDPATGELNWELGDVLRARCVASPIQVGELIFAAAGNGAGERQACAMRPGSKKDGTAPKLEYQITRGTSYVPTPITVGSRLYIWGDSGIITCADAATGRLLWSERVGGTFLGSPVCVAGRLYAMSSDGELVVIEASEQFKLLGRSPLGEGSHATPSVAGGVMYLRTESHLISVGGKKTAALARKPVSLARSHAASGP